jgi:hypothetical protein
VEAIVRRKDVRWAAAASFLIGALCLEGRAYAGTKAEPAASAASQGPAKKAKDGAAAKVAAQDGNKAAAQDGNKAAAADTDVRRVKPGRYIEVLARDLRLNKTGRERLARIAERYFKATRKRLVVTGGTRTPARQAQLMHAKLERGEDIVKLYENKAAATEVRDVYRAVVARKVSRQGRIRAIRKRVEEQIARGAYVSKHLKAGAVDVRSRTMTPAQVAAFRAAVAKEVGVILMDERDTAEPHFHLSL